MARKRIKVLNVAGARPNFPKIGPIMSAMSRNPEFEPLLVHTGQHYDYDMSSVFFSDLGIPEPDIYLNVGSHSHATQTANIMIGFENVIMKTNPDLVLVVGDVNSTVACSLVASKLNIPVAHVEAGLRSRDRTMPEEINRIVTDAISDYLFTPSADADDNLRSEGVPEERIILVGNVMIDSLMRSLSLSSSSDITERLGLAAKGYGVLTLHRPSNVDNRNQLSGIIKAIVSLDFPIVFPVHPRTRANLQDLAIQELVRNSRISLIEPLGYLDFVKLVKDSRVVFTDSGGLQEETTYLGVSCLTIRENTERPITISQGTNVLVGTNPKNIAIEGLRAISGPYIEGKHPDLWDGYASQRIIDSLLVRFSSN